MNTVLHGKKFLRIIVFLAAVFIGLFYYSNTFAAVKTWDNTSGDGLWSTCTNWDTDTCPGASDVATFNATSNTASAIDVSFAGSVVGIDIQAGYTNTITNQRAAGLTIGATGFSQAAGVFAGGSNAIDLNGPFVLTGGTFTSTSGSMNVNGTWTHTAGGTFAHNSGTVVWDGAGNNWTCATALATSCEFYNFSVNTASLDPLHIFADPIEVYGATNLTDGDWDTGDLQTFGSVTVASTYGAGTRTGLLKFMGSSPQTFDLTGATTTSSHSVEIDKTETVTLLSDYSFTGLTLRTFTLTAGGFNISTFTFTLGSSHTYTQTAGTFTGTNGTVDMNTAMNINGGTFLAPSGNMTVDGTLIAGAGVTFTHNNGTVTFDSNGTTNYNVDSSLTFYNVILNRTNGYDQLTMNSDTLVTEGTLTLTKGQPMTGVFQPQGNVVVSSGYGSSSTATFTFAGSANQSFDLTGATNVVNGDITINKSGGAVDLSSSLVMDAASQDLTITSGTLDINGQILTVSGSGGTFPINSGGTLRLQGGESPSTPTINAGSTIAYDGAVGPYTIKNWSYKSLTIAGGASSVFSLPGTKNIGEILTITSGILDAADQGMDISGNTVINGGTLMTGTGTITFGDAAGDSVTISSGELKIESDDVSTDIIKTAGTWTNSGGTITYMSATGITSIVRSGLSPYYNLTINSTGSTYALNGAIVVNNDLTLTAGTLGVSASNYGISVGGSWIDTGAGAFTEGSGTVTFTGTGTINANEGFYTVTINASGTHTLGNTLTVSRSLNLTAGTLDVSASNYGITVARNWAKTSGNFTPRSGTVTFNDVAQTSTISGSTTFYNLTVTTASKTLTFTAGTTQTVSNLLTLTGGGVGTEVTLQSTLADNTWYINATTSSVDYVSVRDSTAGTAITHAVDSSRSIDQGNNVNWGFNVAPTVATITAVEGADGTGDITITFIMDDGDDDDTLQAKIEYSLNGGSTWADPTISTTGAETSATYGDPSIDNAQTYQVGQAGAYITSSSGANTVTIIWEAATDILSTIDISNAQIKVTPYDGTEAGSAGTSSNFILDVVDPTGLANFSRSIYSSINAKFTWTGAADSNFNHYEIWSASVSSDASNKTGGAVEWDNSDDATLATASTATTTVTGNLQNKYVAIFAVDDYGNDLTTTVVYVPYITEDIAESDSDTAQEKDYQITITSPEAGDSFTYGNSVTISWISSGADSFAYVDLYFSVDGVLYSRIAQNLSVYDSPYSWNTDGESFADSSIQIRADATDLADVLDTTFSGEFTITGIPADSDDATDEPTTLPITGERGVSPVTGEYEDISQVEAGMFVKSPYFSTVYFIDENMKRRPFMDAQTFFTWADSFDEIGIVTDATLPTLTLGSPMLPKAGITMIKIQSDPKVYMVEEDNTLRWVTTEEIAKSLYGVSWNAYIIDIEPTFFSKFIIGEDIEDSSGISIDFSKVKSRALLNV